MGRFIVCVAFVSALLGGCTVRQAVDRAAKHHPGDVVTVMVTADSSCVHRAAVEMLMAEEKIDQLDTTEKDGEYVIRAISGGDSFGSKALLLGLFGPFSVASTTYGSDIGVWIRPVRKMSEVRTISVPKDLFSAPVGLAAQVLSDRIKAAAEASCR